MRSIIGGLAIAAVIVGCGTDPDPLLSAPTCEVALTHFYAAGCSYGENNQAGLDFEITACRDQVNKEPASCRDEAAAYLECLNAEPNQAAGTCICDAFHPNCACMAEFDAMMSCK